MNDDVKDARKRIIVALDYGTGDDALALVRRLDGAVSFFKIGLQLYTAAGPDIVRAVSDTGARVFLDLKLHDIPNTVAKAVEAAARLNVAMLTLHLCGGATMLSAAAAAAPADLLLLGVTVLTSSDDETLRQIGVASTVSEQVLRLAELGSASGIRGVIASPHELVALRGKLGLEVTIITPGVRPTWSATDDQKRFATPQDAMRDGADYLVIGRPITAHRDPAEAVRLIADEIVA